MNFVKMHGIGNDFIFVEDLKNEIKNEGELSKKVCNRHFGIGADGLVIIKKDNNIFEMVIINSDGSYASMCGNAIRCFGKYIYDKGFTKDKKFKVKTGDGIKEIELLFKDEKVTGAKVYMGKPSYKGEDIGLKDGLDEVIKKTVKINDKEYELTSVLVGVPHTIIIGKENEYNVNEGALIEKYEFFKSGTNVNFVTIKDRKNIIVETFERGAGATLACGTGASASVEVLRRFHLVDDVVKTKLPGGDLTIEIKNEGIYMSGNAEYICEGKIL
ncbi:diaminopimelate epimerase [Clostridium chrysemydis]|uniref:diaminopimelate epimerase n=1 Tax=Clostridium chrysemydis TaxID=2665504 RepID=UPI00188343EE|nr:diaminopimelate epimerase [Clostridium chrysemydis]